MNSHKVVASIFFSLFVVFADAQIFPKKNYPKGYFVWPVQAKIGLAANFGELRPNHYHMGLDCKTDQKENMPILAAADGYIAKVKIEPSGFGQALYINHPNGLTTLYAHLNSFYPELQRYIKAQQYKLKSWAIFIDVPPHLFDVEKGQQVALSGNTGGSQGPHLHFEIRDTETDKVLNPLLFGFPVTDNIPPSILRLAVYDRRFSTYEQSPQFYTLKKVNGAYTTTPALIIKNTNFVSFAITAFDKYTGSTNQNGIYEAVLYDDEKPIVGFQMDSISYDETRYLNAHVDYKLRSTGGPFVQHLSRLPGYTNGIYKDVSGDGVISLDPGFEHHIKIEVKDPNGNTSLVKFNIKSDEAILSYRPYESTYDPNEFHPDFINIFENDKISFYLPENALYEPIRFKYKETPQLDGSDIFQLHTGNVPVQSRFPIRIKNTTTTYPDKLVMHRWWGAKDDYAKAESINIRNENGWYQTDTFRAFGNVQLIEDLIPPTITPIGFKEGMDMSKLYSIRFVIVDNTEELKNFKAEIDGKWVCFSNDKGRTFIYKFDENCGPGEHELKISVEDCVGNRTVRVYHFTR